MSFRFAIVALLLLPRLAVCQPGVPSGADLLGRPLRWSEPVNGWRASLNVPRQRMLFGQPLEVTLRAVPNGPAELFVRFHRDGPEQTIFLRLTTSDGKEVPLTQEFREGLSSLNGNSVGLRLLPSGPLSRRGYLLPGDYRLTATIEARATVRSNDWTGRIEVAPVDLQIFESTDEGRQKLVPEDIREKATSLVTALDASRQERRDAAERELLKLGFDVLPLVEPALASPSTEQRNRARRIFFKLTEPFHAPQGRPLPEIGPYLAALTDNGWTALGEKLQPQTIDAMRVEAALHGPVPLKPPADPLPEDVVARLLAGLKDPAAHVRVATARAVPPTQNGEVLRAVIALLGDPYRVVRHMGPDPYPEPIVAIEVSQHVLPALGDGVAELVLDTVRNSKDAIVRHYGARLLGGLPHDKRLEEYFREQLEKGSHAERLEALEALGRYGEAGRAHLLKFIEATPPDSPAGRIQRRVAIEQFARTGDAKSVGPTLAQLLKGNDPETLLAAVQAVSRLEVKGTEADLLRLISAPVDRRKDPLRASVRAFALGAYIKLAPKKDVETLLLALVKDKDTSIRGHAAVGLQRIGCRSAIPVVLDLLGDPEWFVRVQADAALRGFANEPRGVGYDARGNDASKWREYWKGKKD